MIVCATCGVEIAEAKNGRLVHLDDIPLGYDLFHDIQAMHDSEFQGKAIDRILLKGAAEDMLIHHATLCPASTCQWSKSLQRAIKQSEPTGMQS